MVAVDATPVASPLHHVLDIYSDLRLEVGTGSAKHTFAVCSRSVARASRPFQTMLYGGFAEAKTRQTDAHWTVALPEDEPAAFATLMDIVHGHFNKVPVAVTRDQLYQITVLTDKYDMTDVLQPWANAWVSPLCTRQPTFAGDETLIWIAWELGHSELFTNTLTFLLKNCGKGSSGITYSAWPGLQGNLLVASLGVLGEFPCGSHRNIAASQFADRIRSNIHTKR